MAPPKKLDKIKSGVFSRGFSLAKMTLGTGASLAGHGLNSMFATDAEKDMKWKEFLKSRASSLTSELGMLKGSLMKAGQMLSMYGEHFLPPEANEMLKTLQSQSPPLEWPAISKVLLKELGPEKMALLEIETSSVGSASMGQVHRATVKATGQVLALKIQYPGVERAIDSDLRALKSFLSLMKVLPHGVSTDAIFAEIKTMMVQETDYELEARETETYRQLLSGDERFIVPKVNREFSNKRILASSFERGINVDDPRVLSLPQERRNRLALSYLDLYFMELFEWGVVQTDPHLGNYKVRLAEDGQHDQLVLFDFGAIRKYPDSFLGPYRQMVKSALIGNLAELNRAATELSFLEDADQPELRKLFQDFCLATVEPFLEPSDPRNTHGQLNAQGEYDWKKSDLTERLPKMVMQVIQKFKWRAPPPEVLFLNRKTGGTFIFLSVLGAKVNSRPLLLQRMKKVP